MYLVNLVDLQGSCMHLEALERALDLQGGWYPHGPANYPVNPSTYPVKPWLIPVTFVAQCDSDF